METRKTVVKAIFVDIDGVLQPCGMQDRFKHDMEALRVWLTQAIGVDYTQMDMYDISAVYYDWFTPAVDRLKKILKVTGAKIVISSNWRTFGGLPKMKALFAIKGLGDEVVDIVDVHDSNTPLGEELYKGMGYNYRTREILQYLTQHPELKSYVVIDDMDLTVGLEEHFVRTDDFITEEDCRKCIAILDRA